ncbi:glycerol acyltransferase [Mumia zhuanghuii]|uniref:1-acyl-sn-glycerol-3-phosphate acyltransferase n=2 Tax=Mumia TaxID=1546255 RepID=A0ABW1QP33_9ACTN|nr:MULTISPECIES: lysophospholipid acyltransferase family protein [Mumia]KAA1422140.1 glycerol acyltransferase [Mumia zhuanghuii]
MPDAPQEPTVPLGTGGRPGRGTGSATPSSAARSLAGGSARPAPKAAPKPAPDAEPASDPSAPAEDPRPAAKTVKKTVKRTTKKAAPAPPPEGSASEDSSPEEATARPAFSLIVNDAPEPADDERPGIPLSDLVAALAHGARTVLGEDWEGKAAVLLSTLRRRLTGSYEIDEFGLDPQLHAIAMAALRPIADKWFRIEVRGAEHIPADGGALVVANHSGTVPVDALMTMLTVNDHGQRTLRLLGADLVFDLPFVGELARKMGATLACNEDAERLLADGHIVGVWPEGFKGIGKPYSERYKLQRFGRGGFVSAAMRAGVPIVPVSIVGAEEIYPLVGNVPSLARLLGIPYVPITPFFPWLGPLGLIPLPSKWIIEFGEPVRTDAYPPEAADDPMLVFNVTDQVRETIQQTLYALLVDRGHPFV